MKYKAIALDLDGTLTDSNKELTEKTKHTLFKAMDRGVKLILASGRAVMGIAHLARELELYSRGGYIMAFNGGVIIECKTGKRLRSLTLPPECTADVCAAAREAGAVPLTYTDSEIVAQSDTDEYVLKEKKCLSAPVRKVEDLCSFVDYLTPKFLIVGENKKLVKAEKILKEKYIGRLNIFYSEPYFLEVCPLGVSKDEGLRVIMESIGGSREELMACGDGMNDIPMLDYAGFGVAMANACDGVLARADYITLSNDEDGVAAAVEKFILAD